MQKNNYLDTVIADYPETSKALSELGMKDAVIKSLRFIEQEALTIKNEEKKLNYSLRYRALYIA